LNQIVEGVPLRDHLLSVQQRTGRVPDKLANAAPLPIGCNALWRDFIALHVTRPVGTGSPGRIPWTEIDAYQRVRGIRFEAWQIDALRRADGEYMAHIAAQSKG